MKTKESIQRLIKYEAKQINARIVLSANETKNYLFGSGYTFTNDFSKYPEVNGDSLRTALAQKYNLSMDNFIIGNGSTELLELVVKTYCEKEDSILTFDPSFSMYDIYGMIYGVTVNKVPTGEDFIQSIDKMLEYITRYNPKLLFVCNPNNPTGNLVKRKDIIRLLDNTDALVVVDEAYMEFVKESESVADLIDDYDNLIVARTFSKAYGLASSRLGYMIGNAELMNNLFKVKLPYNVNSLTLQLGLEALKMEAKMYLFVDNIITQREILKGELEKMGYKVYPSFGNFIYLKTEKDLFNTLLEKDILIRSFNNGCYRITVGSNEENIELLQALMEV